MDNHADIPKSKPVLLGTKTGHGINTADQPHSVFRPAGTDSWILEYTAAGCSYVRRDGHEFLTREGDVVLFPSGVIQDYGMDRHVNHSENYWLSFMPRPAWYEWLKWPEPISGVPHLHIARPELREAILARLRHAGAIARGPLARQQEFLLNAAEEILLWCDTVNPLTSHAILDPRIQHALEWLCSHYAERITLDTLSKACHLSISRLSHLFHSQIHVSPMQYLERHRFQQASELLLMSNRSVAQVAYAVGYEDPLYFSRIFRRHAGTSPRQFRKSGR